MTKPGNKTRAHATVPVVRGSALDGEILPPEPDVPPQAPPKATKRLTLDDLKRRRGESQEEFIRRLPPGMGPRWGEGKSDAWKKRLEKARRDLRPYNPVLAQEERAATKSAEREVEWAWAFSPEARTLRANPTWRTNMRVEHPLDRALREARANAREELRQKRRMADEERKAREVPLPAHITRMRKRREPDSA
jgi:hypothetical protein